MNTKEYLQKINDVTFCMFSPNEKTKIKLHLMAPKKKKDGLSFTLIIQGNFFARLSTMEGILFHEFMANVIQSQKLVQNQEDRNTFVKNAVDCVCELYPNEISDSLSETLTLMLDEIVRIKNHTALKHVFHSIYPYTFARTMHSPFGIKYMEGNAPSTKANMLDLLDKLSKQNIVHICYNEEMLKNPSAMDIFRYKVNMYQSIQLENSCPKDKQLTELKMNCIDELIYHVDGATTAMEYMITGRNLKEITQSIKQAIHLGFDVKVITHLKEENKNYIELLKMLHKLGIKSFSLDFDMHLEESDVIVKQAYFYTKINGLTLSLEKKNILKYNQWKKMVIHPGYYDDGISYLYVTSDESVYLTNQIKDKVASLNDSTLKQAYATKLAKRNRKEILKRSIYEK